LQPPLLNSPGNPRRTCEVADSTPPGVRFDRELRKSTIGRHRQDFSLKLELGWLEPAIGPEVEETVADPAVERSRGEFIASLGRLVELIHQGLERVPIVIIDDSDPRAGSSARRQLVSAVSRADRSDH
jgi:hypothetical protein